MALNPFFLQGSQSEQRLVQSLINEHLQIYGVEVAYLPRRIVKKDNIFTELESSAFVDNFSIEAYVNTYEGYGGAGDVMTKFGMSLKDEVILTISKERFEDFIAPFLDASDFELGSRPREGDLIYFPLGQRLFEVKFVEHEKPFYQLQKNYVYELQCELFEYEDEIIDTSIDEIDTQVQDEGFITTLELVGSGTTALASAVIAPSITPTGYIRSLTILNDGNGYTSTPTVFISTSRHVQGVNASAVAITTSVGGVQSVKELLLTNAGAGYTQPPNINIVGGGGSGAIATCTIEKTQKGVIQFAVTGDGAGYVTPPTVTIAGPGSGTTAIGVPVIDVSNGELQSIRIKDPGQGYTSAPTVTIGPPDIITGRGNFELNDIITGQTSGTQARVKEWDSDTKVLKVSNVGIGTTTLGFLPGEEIRSTTIIFVGTKFQSGTCGVNSTRIVGVDTSGIAVGAAMSAIDGVISVGTTVLALEPPIPPDINGNILMSRPSLNTSAGIGTQLITVGTGTTQLVIYNVKAHDTRDIYDSYSDNDEFETEADAIIDFAESNPFGTF